ncbi:hypothetical protein H4R19_003557 [Coemansia spiralis]|nr:hypothetical protein H4R19_003557 [Coemansia spiralis]
MATLSAEQLAKILRASNQPSFATFSPLVHALLRKDQEEQAAPTVDALGWLADTHARLTAAGCPEQWLVEHALAGLPLNKRSAYRDEHPTAESRATWPTFAAFVTKSYCRAVNGIDAFVALLQLPMINDLPTLQQVLMEAPALGRLATAPDSVTALFVLVRLPPDLRIQLVRGIEDMAQFSTDTIRTAATAFFGSRGNYMEIDSVSTATATAPSYTDVCAVKGGRPALPAFALVEKFGVTRAEFEARAAAGQCLACGDNKHTFRRCPLRTTPKGRGD